MRKLHRLAPIPLLAFLCLLSLSCAQKKPVLYPNARYEQAGAEAAKADIAECMRMAEEHGVDAGGKGEKVAGKAAKGALVGAAAGAAVGAVFGNFGQGLAAGAAGGGASGAAQGALESGDPDAVYRRFVEKCLRDKGYEPIGWK